MADVPDYVREFLETLYPGAADLTPELFDERTTMVDATRTITALRTELAECRSTCESLRTERDRWRGVIGQMIAQRKAKLAERRMSAFRRQRR